MSRWAWVWRVVSRRLWFRAAAFSLAAVVLALLAPLVAPLVPYTLGAKIGADAVDNILGIIASSMLAVTTFSLTAMVSAYGAATSNVTPRAVALLGAQLRVFDKMARVEGQPVDDRVVFPALEIEKLVVDAFRAIGRDGAGTVEVAVKLQKTLAALAAVAPDWAAAARHAAEDAKARARVALTTEEERLAVVRAFADWPE